MYIVRLHGRITASSDLPVFVSHNITVYTYDKVFFTTFHLPLLVIIKYLKCSIYIVIYFN